MQALVNILVFGFVSNDKDFKPRHRGCHYKIVNAGA
jgi:hypothetical protein